MKIRNGFISNSSSSSFILQKKDLTPIQIYAIENHIEMGRALGMDGCNPYDRWTTRGLRNEKSEVIHLSTSMNNFSMLDFLKKIGVPDEAIPDNAGEEDG